MTAQGGIGRGAGRSLSPSYDALVTGLPTIQTLTWKAKSSYANNETIIDAASGITYELEVDDGTFSATGGAVVVIDIHTATTAAQVDAIASPAMVAEAGSHWTSVSDGAGTSTFTAKTVGSLNNSTFAGTADITAAITQNGSDPIVDSDYPNTNIDLTAAGSTVTGDGIKPVVVTLAQLAALAPKFLTTEGTLGSDLQIVSAKTLLGLSSLACDTLGGFEFGMAGTFGVDPGAVISIRINGLANDTEVSGVTRYINAITAGTASIAAGVTHYSANGSGGMGMQGAGNPTRGWFRYRIECKDPSSSFAGQRRFKVDWHYQYDPGNDIVRQREFDVILNSTGEIDDVGIQSSAAGTWPSATKWWFRRIP